jgi:rod shape-determining protein MreD
VTGRVLFLGLLLVSALLVQTVAAPLLAVGGHRFDVVVLTLVAVALADGPATGVRYGFAAGLATDLLAGSALPVGSSALVLLLVGYAVGGARPYLASAGVVGQVAVVAAASAAVMLLHGLLGVLLDVPEGGLDVVLAAAGGRALYNAALTPLLVRPLLGLWRRGAPSGPALPLR